METDVLIENRRLLLLLMLTMTTGRERNKTSWGYASSERVSVYGELLGFSQCMRVYRDHPAGCARNTIFRWRWRSV
uniref:Putative secreted protein n=1 Tax=Anopheles triannulatus TaxID=58253 RepID=A0A2M4B720_9DIPT